MIILTGDCTDQKWCKSHRGDPAAARLADRHYSRQKVGTKQFVKTGSCAVFLSICGRAFWVTSFQQARWVKHEWPNAWECSAFRSEGAGMASVMIRQAVAATRAHYGDPPERGMITFLNTAKIKPTIVRGKAVYGWTWLKAGFVEVGKTGGGLLVLQLTPDRMPAALKAYPRAVHGLPLFDKAA